MRTASSSARNSGSGTTRTARIDLRKEQRQGDGRILSMPFQKGQKVIVKAPPEVYIGTVIERRPGDANLPEEQAHYEVRIEDERYYRSTDLEAVPPPKLTRYS